MPDNMDNVKTVWEEFAAAKAEINRLRAIIREADALLDEGNPAWMFEGFREAIARARAKLAVALPLVEATN